MLDCLFETFVFTPQDPAVGSIPRPLPSAAELRDKFAHKRALVLGGTKGIGRGIAVQLAEAGCISVDVVGRDAVAGEEVVKEMLAKQKLMDARAAEDCQFCKADLSTIAGCEAFVRSLQAGRCYDLLVMTLGQWPDFKDPLTSEGFNKVIFTDVIARFAVLTSMYEHKKFVGQAAGLDASSSSGGQPVVLSVLASGQKPNVSRKELRNKFACIPEEHRRKSREDIVFARTLQAAGLSHDIMLYQASCRLPQLTFAGTFPGLVVTDVTTPTLGETVTRSIGFLGKALGTMMSKEACGLNHTNILASENIHRAPISFWDHLLKAREVHSKVKDEEFGCWLWARLEEIKSQH